jgi:PadR family transcriptional regulator PadR
MDNDSQIKKGILEIPILIVLSTEKYVSEILQVLEKQDLFIPEGTIYPILTRLIKLEYLQYRWQESTSGPPRKYFKITNSGTQYLKENLKTLEKLFLTIKTLKKLH